MTRSRIAIVGSGQRVRETALPVLETLSDEYELAGIYSRKPKTIDVGRRQYAVESLDALDATRMRELDAVYLVVAKGAVPDVLERLAATEPRNVDLLIETPVLLPKHLLRAGPLGSFRSASVTEDCLTLPLIDAVRACIATGRMGRLKSVVMSHSAYAYHGLAMLKAIAGTDRVTGARRTSSGFRAWVREYRLKGGILGVTLDPRDYSNGRLFVGGEHATLADHDLSEEGHLRISVELEGSRPRVFRAGDSERRLNDAEYDLMGEAREGTGPWVWMDGMKRVGFRQLLLELKAGRSAYPVLSAIDDALVDYHLEKFNRYLPNPLSSARGLLVGTLLRSVSPRPRDWSYGG
ncbi:MAG: hypothetical protein AAFZ65_08550 [Planctomycetota bacterium]